MNTPLVSVILTVFNGESHIGDAIRTVLGQTLDDFELIIVDDGSTDGTERVVREFADTRIRFSSGPHRGRSACLNDAVSLARGWFVAIQDADDLSFPTRLERQIAFLDCHADVDLVASRVLELDVAGVPRGLIGMVGDHPALTAQAWRAIPLAHPAWCGRRSWFGAHQYRGWLRSGEDQEVLYRAASTSTFAGTGEILVAKVERPLGRRQLVWRRLAFVIAALQGDLRNRRWRAAATLVVRTTACAAKLVIDRGRYEPAWRRDAADPAVLRSYEALRGERLTVGDHTA